MTPPPLRIGVAGLGRAFAFMLPTFVRDPRVKLVAAADPKPSARARFAAEFGGAAYDTVESLCADADVDVVYVATPHGDHAGHACAAFAHGKHALVEKPMAVTIKDCTLMIDAAARAGRHLVVGHSHSFDAPIARARAIVASGELGAPRMLHAFYATEFLYRARRPEELRTGDGGGAVFNQAAHQIDIVRLLGGGDVRSVRAHTGNWDPARPTEGAYSALLAFAHGAFATATYSGYAHYDGDELMDGIGEMGWPKRADAYGGARRALRQVADASAEAALKAARSYGGPLYVPADDRPAPAHQHFGHVLVCCERGDVRPVPTGVHVYGDDARRFEPLPAPVGAARRGDRRAVARRRRRRSARPRRRVGARDAGGMPRDPRVGAQRAGRRARASGSGAGVTPAARAARDAAPSRDGPPRRTPRRARSCGTGERPCHTTGSRTSSAIARSAGAVPGRRDNACAGALAHDHVSSRRRSGGAAGSVAAAGLDPRLRWLRRDRRRVALDKAVGPR